MALSDTLKKPFSRDEQKPQAEAPPVSEEEQKFLSRYQEDYSDSSTYRSSLKDEWQRIHDYVQGDQWDAPEDDDEDWMPRPVTNLCRQTLKNTHANIAPGKVSIILTAKSGVSEELVRKVNDVIVCEWDALDMGSKLRNECEWIRPETGIVWFKAPWNPKANGGKGGLDTQVVHPLNVFRDPNITSPREIQQSDFLIFRHEKTKRYVKKRYSKENDKLCRFTKDELETILHGESAEEINYSGEGNTNASAENKIILDECWYRDENGKLQVAWLSCQRVLKHSIDDKKFEKRGFYKHGKYPAIPAPYIPYPKRVEGTSEIVDLLSHEEGRKDGIQDTLNKIQQHALVGLALQGIGQVVYVHGKVKDPDKITAEPGLKIPVKESVDVVQRRNGPELPQSLLMWFQEEKRNAQEATLQWEPIKGEMSSGRHTASEALAAREQGLKPLNDRISSLNDALSELIELWIEQLAEFGFEREYEKSLPDGTVEIFTFNPKEELFIKGKDKNDDPEEENTSERVHFKVKVDVGADLVVTKAYMAELAITMWGQKAIDLQGFYSMMPSWPGKQETLDRMMAQQKAAQEAAAAQAAAQAEAQRQAQMQPPQGTPAGPQGQGNARQVSPEEQAFADFVNSLPEEIAAQINAIPDDAAKMQALEQLFMAQQQGGGGIAPQGRQV